MGEEEKKVVLTSEEIVTEYIETKKTISEASERKQALETLILADSDARKDKRITIVSGRKTTTITDEAYEILTALGEEIEVVIPESRRKKVLSEFPETTQHMILSNPKNFIDTFTKESIRVKNVK